MVVGALLLGCLMTLALSGYQVGKSNHTVYLLDGLRSADPGLLARDWFTNDTLQYHGLFSLLTREVIRAGVLEVVFLAGYLLTVFAFHLAAWRVIRALGGGVGAYLVSIVLLHLSAGGTGLGGFQFLQDGAFLPSNIANVAMLWGIALLMERRPWPAAVAMGVAGVFHLNHAVFAVPVLLAGLLATRGLRTRDVLGPVMLAGALCATNIVPALLHLGGESPAERMPLGEFVQLYARLRHPHHYYPPAWPMVAWVASLWTLVPAALVVWCCRTAIPETSRRVVLAVGGLLVAATVMATLLAGVMFVSERLIQIAVFRFSILYIYLACALTAWGVFDGALLPRPIGRGLFWLAGPALLAGFAAAYFGLAGDVAEAFVRARPGPLWVTAGLAVLSAAYATSRRAGVRPVVCVLAMLPLLVWDRGFGLRFIPEDPPGYVRLARWARENTPRDAMFLVPPQEQAWRIEARRAVVVNFKAVPQTSAELPEWKRRMQDVTGVADLTTLAGTFDSTLRSLGEVYARRDVEALIAVARKYDCQYVVTAGDLPAHPALVRVGPVDGPAGGQTGDNDGTGPFRLYSLAPPSTVPRTSREAGTSEGARR